MSPPPITPPKVPEGFEIFLTWGLVEWGVGVVATGLGGVAAWVWSLGRRTDRLEEVLRAQTEELDEMRETLRELKKEGEEDRKELRELIGEMSEKVVDKVFLIAQLNAMTLRVDGIVDRRVRESSR